NYNICVFAFNGCGPSPITRCVAVRGNLSGATAITSPAVANGTIVCPNSPVSYSTPFITGAASYQWSIAGATITNNGSQNVTVNYSSGFTSGTLCVHGQMSCGFTGPDKCISI